MKRNSLFRLQTLLVLLAVVSNSYGQDQQPLNCDLAEVPAFIITKNVSSKILNDDNDFKGKLTITVTKDLKLSEEIGKKLDIPARFRGEKIYLPYQRYEWDLEDRVYHYSSPENIATVRPHLDQRDSSKPYELLDVDTPLKTISGYECNWTELEIAGVQKIELCNVIFYGWTIDLFSRKVSKGRNAHLSETIDISHQCVKKERIAVPEDRAWQRL